MPAKKRPRPTKAKTKPTSREESMRETRQALVDAALASFAEEGLDASLDGICDRAGFTRGAFYVHFADRESLLVAAMNQLGQQVFATVFASALAAGGAGGFSASARRFADAVAAGDYPLMGGAPGAARVRPHLLLDACARSPAIRDGYRQLVEASAAHVASLVRGESALREGVDPEDVGTLALALVIGAQTMSELGIPIASRMRAFVDLLELAVTSPS